ncbi:hypothetical protein Ancab_028742 [Ancistrocladus abbreviatus]
MYNYRDAFAQRMAMAGLKPHHRIALGVSGGPDSMALCVLTAHWKTSTVSAACDGSGFIDGLLAIIVDHGLRPESKEEAAIVCHRVSNMGIRCEIAHCDWSDGRPKQGHLQEAARDMRYGIFIDTCIQNQMSVLLIAHHANDQAELFILRLSRNSGVLGLAGMAFASQLFPTFPLYYGESYSNPGILLVRPLLEFSKDDLYKICKGDNQKWVEDPTNQSTYFARNRIRIALSDTTSAAFKSELQAVISACRRTRAYVDNICQHLINQVVTIMNHGYAVIDLKVLDPSKREDICLSKFLASILQFISQRQRPVRGSASRLLLEYVRTFPCKTSFTAAGCYLCAAPGTKGSKVLVCCSMESALPSKIESLSQNSGEALKHCNPHEMKQIIMEGKLYSDRQISDTSNVYFLDASSSDSVLAEARKLKLLSDSTYRIICEIRMAETQRFRSQYEEPGSEVKCDGKTVNLSSGEPFHPGQSCYFMNRFLVTWRSSEKRCAHPGCSVCLGGYDMVANLRHMIDADWLFLAKLSKCQDSDKLERPKVPVGRVAQQASGRTTLSSDYVRISAQQALLSLKSIPVAARRGLPVLVGQQGLLLSIPCIGFKHCPCLMVSAEFKPRVPLGGGHTSFI